jgi:hypothetical protein
MVTPPNLLGAPFLLLLTTVDTLCWCLNITPLAGKQSAPMWRNIKLISSAVFLALTSETARFNRQYIYIHIYIHVFM